VDWPGPKANWDFGRTRGEGGGSGRRRTIEASLLGDLLGFSQVKTDSATWDSKGP